MRVRVSRVRFEEREREKKTRLQIAPGCDIRTEVQPPPRSAIYNCTFRPAAADSGSIRRKQVHRATTVGGGGGGREEGREVAGAT